ncbi:alpha/beta hydrolase [Mesorhizobium sp. M2D.F.Ca.ET.185.01.1.1]|nr:alpha/beta hydrolase [Mesorhizobium sp. M2D.F.Ca.ET.140.01.1.1]TGP18793.1 alpha/beta hydrolase [Mesorhizobium sp. M2D.F.Ca.ET.233.01.1.1]TGP36061.1 alpha/beta hydrolase [Mesorhizobium sp. M2D.F.Ca.ET.232.01.1.1]TGP61567.1 alpha/beta hydrolase [Mesorhizobium sp. M2D.F.Ca.ET.226.01.1.1]TGP70843.1 alpha/beta hydrolase [Mesorhizobium sp. M2D.F.Ca.ET.225.01.1.1]TGP78820.1 alpha/beta hydrolase [Mesorhizobium sp. M2D.F.Ca.ET.224.01.1.1]TGP82907.1 alpha/beta hydrolase [bacterium M00.F.Ca.ET.227.01
MDAAVAKLGIERFIHLQGTKLHFLEAGSGQPLLLLHGNGASAEDFTTSGIFDRAAARYRVLAFDRPGFGMSPRPAGRLCSASFLSAPPDGFCRASTRSTTLREPSTGSSCGESLSTPACSPILPLLGVDRTGSSFWRDFVIEDVLRFGRMSAGFRAGWNWKQGQTSVAGLCSVGGGISLVTAPQPGEATASLQQM